MKCLLVGPGAIGLTIATAVLDNGVDVDIASRSHFDEISYTGPDGSTKRRRAKVFTDPATTGSYDVVFFATKVTQTQAASAWLKAAAGPDTIVVVLHNGIQHRENMAPYLPPTAPVVPVVIYTPAQKLSPGVVINTGRASLDFPNDEPSGRVAKLFDGSFVKINLTDDWHTSAWLKLMLNSSSGILSTLTRKSLAANVDDDATDLLRSLLAEALLVARADGANLDDNIVDSLTKMLTSGKIEHVPSIAADRIAGRPTEWRARNQIIIDKAAEHGVDVPLHQMGTTLMRLGEPD